MLKAALIFIVLVCTMGSVRAQVSALPPEVQQAIRAGGPVINGDVNKATTAALAPLHASSPPADVKEAVNVRYGPDEAQHLDVFTPQKDGATAAPRPVLIFVPGGGFATVDQRADGLFRPQNVGYAEAHNGLVVVIAAHRLLPKNTYPAGAEDVGAVVEWVRGHIASYGGDPNQVVLMGHSAGASHVADYMARATSAGGPPVRGAILISGTYDLSSVPASGNNARYYSDDPALRADRSATRGLMASRIPMLLVAAELDPAPTVQQAEQLHAALCGRGNAPCPRLLRLAGHNHFSEVFDIGTADREFANEIATFVRQPM